jgi:hypothetical protein
MSRGDVATKAQKPGFLTLLPFALLVSHLWTRCMLGSSLGCCYLGNGFFEDPSSHRSHPDTVFLYIQRQVNPERDGNVSRKNLSNIRS